MEQKEKEEMVQIDGCISTARVRGRTQNTTPLNSPPPPSIPMHYNNIHCHPSAISPPLTSHPPPSREKELDLNYFVFCSNLRLHLRSSKNI